MPKNIDHYFEQCFKQRHGYARESTDVCFSWFTSKEKYSNKSSSRFSWNSSRLAPRSIQVRTNFNWLKIYVSDDIIRDLVLHGNYKPLFIIYYSGDCKPNSNCSFLLTSHLQKVQGKQKQLQGARSNSLKYISLFDQKISKELLDFLGVYH